MVWTFLVKAPNKGSQEKRDKSVCTAHTERAARADGSLV